MCHHSTNDLTPPSADELTFASESFFAVQVATGRAACVVASVMTLMICGRTCRAAPDPLVTDKAVYGCVNVITQRNARNCEPKGWLDLVRRADLFFLALWMETRLMTSS